jgi:hypothetical protein
LDCDAVVRALNGVRYQGQVLCVYSRELMDTKHAPLARYDQRADAAFHAKAARPTHVPSQVVRTNAAPHAAASTQVANAPQPVKVIRAVGPERLAAERAARQEFDTVWYRDLKAATSTTGLRVALTTPQEATIATYDESVDCVTLALRYPLRAGGRTAARFRIVRWAHPNSFVWLGVLPISIDAAVASTKMLTRSRGGCGVCFFAHKPVFSYGTWKPAGGPPPTEAPHDKTPAGSEVRITMDFDYGLIVFDLYHPMRGAAVKPVHSYTFQLTSAWTEARAAVTMQFHSDIIEVIE